LLSFIHQTSNNEKAKVEKPKFDNLHRLSPESYETTTYDASLNPLQGLQSESSQRNIRHHLYFGSE
jgi:hypothetical protein